MNNTIVSRTIYTEQNNTQAMLDRAKELVNSGLIKHSSIAVIQNDANTDMREFLADLKEIASQAYDPMSANLTTKIFGEELVNIAKALNPVSESKLLIKNLLHEGLKSIKKQVIYNHQ